MSKFKDALATAGNIWRTSMPIDDLRALRRQLAKAANQRMVRLENTKSPVTGESYDFGAYDVAQEYLEKQGRHRFSEVKNVKDMDYNDLRREISELEGFLTSKSSSIKGMHEIEKVRIESFEKKGIKSASNKEFYNFLKSETFKKLTDKAGFNSEDIIEEYQKAADRGMKPAQIQKAFDEYRSKRGRKTIKNMRGFISARGGKK